MTTALQSNGAESSPLPKPQIQAIQSVVPYKITEPRTARFVSLEDGRASGVLQKRLNMVFYYDKCSDQYSGWLVAGWLKESLSRALTEQPLLSGRLRRRDGGEAGEIEIVPNDSGVRLVEAKTPVTLSDFMEMKGVHDKDAALVYWKDIDEENPNFCPLSFVQVTNFECGGYSIGISCSLLLADIILMADFLQRWKTIHKNLIAGKGSSNLPIFYHPVLKPGIPNASIINAGATHKRGRTMNFKIAADESLCKSLALMCIEEAEKKHRCETAQQFTLLLKEPSGDVKVQSWVKDGEARMETLIAGEQLAESTMEDLGLDNVAFCEGSKPARVSLWVVPASDGVVMAIPCADGSSTSQLKILVSVPCEQENA